MTPDPIFRKIFDFGYGSGKKTQNPAGFDSTPPLQIRGHLCFLYRIRSVGWRYRYLGVTAAPGGHLRQEDNLFSRAGERRSRCLNVSFFVALFFAPLVVRGTDRKRSRIISFLTVMTYSVTSRRTSRFAAGWLTNWMSARVESANSKNDSRPWPGPWRPLTAWWPAGLILLEPTSPAPRANAPWPPFCPLPSTLAPATSRYASWFRW